MIGRSARAIGSLRSAAERSGGRWKRAEVAFVGASSLQYDDVSQQLTQTCNVSIEHCKIRFYNSINSYELNLLELSRNGFAYRLIV